MKNLTTCRYLDWFSNRCTAEAVDNGAEILLCPKHLAAAWRLIMERMEGLPDEPEQTAAA